MESDRHKRFDRLLRPGLGCAREDVGSRRVARGDIATILLAADCGVQLRGETCAIEDALRQIQSLQAELMSLQLRHAQRSSQKLNVGSANDFGDSMREVAAAL